MNTCVHELKDGSCEVWELVLKLLIVKIMLPTKIKREQNVDITM